MTQFLRPTLRLVLRARPPRDLLASARPPPALLAPRRPFHLFRALRHGDESLKDVPETVTVNFITKDDVSRRILFRSFVLIKYISVSNWRKYSCDKMRK